MTTTTTTRKIETKEEFLKVFGVPCETSAATIEAARRFILGEQEPIYVVRANRKSK